MISKIDCACLMGLDAAPVQVQVSLARGLPTFSIVGLPDAATREARDRVVAAIRNSGFDFPSTRLTVNLAPAELKKEGSVFDLAIAMGILLASGTIAPQFWPRAVWLGELALDGAIQPVRGALAMVRSLRDQGVRSFVLPSKNAAELRYLPGAKVFPFGQLKEVVQWLHGEAPAPELKPPAIWHPAVASAVVDFEDIKGQALAKRAAEIAAAGHHNFIMVGTPGTGKSMLAQAMPSILPAWTLDEALDATQIHTLVQSFAGQGLLNSRPFRAPHHLTSSVALVGGGDTPTPGELSMAHHGVLFLDELPEFRRDVLEALRQPLEENVVHVLRVRGRATFPANFLLVAAMNPCPCGHRGHPRRQCFCSDAKVQKYRAKISAPLLDRMDLQIELAPLTTDELLTETHASETSERVRARVDAARARQMVRSQKESAGAPYNARLRGAALKKFCALDAETRALLQSASDRLGFSARAFDRIRRVARTIADLAGAEAISVAHVAEAIQYRALDRPHRQF